MRREDYVFHSQKRSGAVTGSSSKNPKVRLLYPHQTTPQILHERLPIGLLRSRPYVQQRPLHLLTCVPKTLDSPKSEYFVSHIRRRSQLLSKL